MKSFNYDVYLEDIGIEDTEESKTLHEIDHYFEGILDHLYGSENLDENNLDRCVEEICALLGKKLPKRPINVQRKLNFKFNI